ncbi:TetR/AcrR family transcriptional regulator [Streptomyces sp. JV185]|uniref:TetR/AcrR family transcriptional regulator n=1 Tax=Streptomyces sp. JV185 TaxID=858638 RepID=UPI002E77E4B8|nr:TetR/AcrR family transcriptional regulator [Streptomyces sp. JV185]MEE1772386.1 TetR/AcrR family transcriptional regulator [Streptomyces sp. JV185]
MAAKESSRTARRVAATRQAIIEAAEEILVAGGFPALTLEAVAERADVAVQTVYNRVGGRSDVLVAVAERAFEENRGYMDAAYAAPGTPRERILLAADAYTRFALESPHHFRLLAEPPGDAGSLEGIADLVDEQNAKLTAALRDGVADGSFNPDLDPRATAYALWAAMNGVLALSWRADRLRVAPPDMGSVLDTILALMTRGLDSRT